MTHNMMGMLETRQEECEIFKRAPGLDDPFYSDGNMRYLERKMEVSRDSVK